MQVYLIRHGLAGESGSYANDDERPLTKEGRKKARTCAQRLNALGIAFELILTSPLVRARQTAEILKEEGLSPALEVFAPLAPGGSLASWLEWLSNWSQQPLALVGHNPDLSDWAETLVWGEARGVIVLKKTGLICLELPEAEPPVGRSLLTVLLPPKLLAS